jgi:hypothetical protein
VMIQHAERRVHELHNLRMQERHRDQPNGREGAPHHRMVGVGMPILKACYGRRLCSVLGLEMARL